MLLGMLGHPSSTCSSTKTTMRPATPLTDCPLQGAGCFACCVLAVRLGEGRSLATNLSKIEQLDFDRVHASLGPTEL